MTNDHEGGWPLPAGRDAPCAVEGCDRGAVWSRSGPTLEHRGLRARELLYVCAAHSAMLARMRTQEDEAAVLGRLRPEHRRAPARIAQTLDRLVDQRGRPQEQEPPPLLPRLLDPLALPPAVNHPADRERLTWIFGLSDPRDGLPRVIGRSVTPQRAGLLGARPGLLDGGQPWELPYRATPRMRWAVELCRHHRLPVLHLLACVPEALGERYKRWYVDVADQLGAPLVVRSHSVYLAGAPSLRVEQEAAWSLLRAYPTLLPGAAGTGMGEPPVYSEEVRARLARPALPPVSQAQYEADCASDEYDALRWEAFAHQQDAWPDDEE